MFPKDHSLSDNWIKLDKRHFVLGIVDIFAGSVKETSTSGAHEFDGNGFALASGH